MSGMKNGIFILMFVGIIGLAYFSAQSSGQKRLDLNLIQIGMTEASLKAHFGSPSNKNRNQLTYILEDYSELVVTLRDNLVSSAKVKFHRPLQIEDPKLRQLTLVQMDTLLEGQPSWFLAGNPEEGLIYKVTAAGVVESITWIRPFSYGLQRPKELQALFRDFNIQRSLNM
jgi:hypothetical protein